MILLNLRLTVSLGSVGYFGNVVILALNAKHDTKIFLLLPQAEIYDYKCFLKMFARVKQV